jgi:hypothetical protein
VREHKFCSDIYTLILIHTSVCRTKRAKRYSIDSLMARLTVRNQIGEIKLEPIRRIYFNLSSQSKRMSTQVAKTVRDFFSRKPKERYSYIIVELTYCRCYTLPAMSLSMELFFAKERLLPIRVYLAVLLRYSDIQLFGMLVPRLVLVLVFWFWFWFCCC